MRMVGWYYHVPPLDKSAQGLQEKHKASQAAKSRRLDKSARAVQRSASRIRAADDALHYALSEGERPRLVIST